MILILDNLVNNYLNILSCLIILLIPNLNKKKYFTLLCIDIILNTIPLISIFILFLYFLNKFIFKKIIKNRITLFISVIIYYFIFISLIYTINEYDFTYIYYIKNNIISFIYNIIIYYIYIFYSI